MNYNINLFQKLTGEYFLLVYINSKKIAEIFVGTTIDEAKKTAQDIKDAFESTDINDQT